MSKKQIHNLIEKQSEQKTAAKERMLAAVSPRDAVAEVKKRRMGVWQWSAVAASACALCLAVILPIALGTPEQQDVGRYCSAAEIVNFDLGCSIKEYSSERGLNMLYLDWYDVCEYVPSYKHCLTDGGDVVFLSEDFVNLETWDDVTFVVHDVNTHIDVYDEAYASITQNENYEGYSINYDYAASVSRAYFDYDGYRYYIQYFDPPARDMALSIAKEILSGGQARQYLDNKGLIK